MDFEKLYAIVPWCIVAVLKIKPANWWNEWLVKIITLQAGVTHTGKMFISSSLWGMWGTAGSVLWRRRRKMLPAWALYRSIFSAACLARSHIMHLTLHHTMIGEEKFEMLPEERKNPQISYCFQTKSCACKSKGDTWKVTYNKINNWLILYVAEAKHEHCVWILPRHDSF